MNVLDVDRAVFVTDDIEATIERFESLLDLSFGEPRQAETDETVRVAYSHPGLELMAPRVEDSPIATYLAESGPGVWGLVFRVADLEAAAAELAEAGVEPINEGGPPEAPELFFHPGDFGGLMTILTEYPHPVDW